MAKRFLSIPKLNNNASSKTKDHPLDLLNANNFDKFLRTYSSLETIRLAFPDDPGVVSLVEARLLTMYEQVKKGWLNNRQLNFNTTAFRTQTLFDRVENWLVDNVPNFPSRDELRQLAENPSSEALEGLEQQINEAIREANTLALQRSTTQANQAPSGKITSDQLFVHYPNLAEQIKNSFRVSLEHQAQLAQASEKTSQAAATVEVLTKNSGQTAYHVSRQDELEKALKDAAIQASFRNPQFGQDIERQAQRMSSQQGVSVDKARDEIFAHIASNLVNQLPARSNMNLGSTETKDSSPVDRSTISATVITLSEDKQKAKVLEEAVRAATPAETAAKAAQVFTGDDSRDRAAIFAQIVHSSDIPSDNKVFATAQLLTNTPLDPKLPEKAAQGAAFKEESFERIERIKATEGASPQEVAEEMRILEDISLAEKTVRQSAWQQATAQAAVLQTPVEIDATTYGRILSDPNLTYEDRVEETAHLIAQANNREKPVSIDVDRAERHVDHALEAVQNEVAGSSSNTPTKTITAASLQALYSESNDTINDLNRALAAPTVAEQVDRLQKVLAAQKHPDPQQAAEALANLYNDTVSVSPKEIPQITADIVRGNTKIIPVDFRGDSGLDTEGNQALQPKIAALVKALDSPSPSNQTRNNNIIPLSSVEDTETAQLAAIRQVVQRKVLIPEIAREITTNASTPQKIKAVAQVLQTNGVDAKEAQGQAVGLVGQINDLATSYIRTQNIPADPLLAATTQAVQTLIPKSIAQSDLDQIVTDPNLSANQKTQKVASLIASAEGVQSPIEFQTIAQELVVLHTNKAEIARISADPRWSTTEKKTKIGQLVAKNFPDSSISEKDLSSQAQRILTKVENKTSALLNQPTATAVDIANSATFFANKQIAQLAAVKQHVPEGVNREKLAQIVVSNTDTTQAAAELIAQSRGEKLSSEHQKEARRLLKNIDASTSEFMNHPQSAPVDRVEQAQIASVKELTPPGIEPTQLIQKVTDISLSEKDRVEQAAQLFAQNTNEVLSSKHYKQARQFLKQVDQQTDVKLNTVVAEAIQETQKQQLTARQTTVGAVYANFDEQTAINISNALNNSDSRTQIKLIQTALERQGHSSDKATVGAALIVESAQGNLTQEEIAKAIAATKVGVDLGSSVTEAKNTLASVNSDSFKELLTQSGASAVEAEQISLNARALSGEALKVNNRTLLLDQAVSQTIQQQFSDLDKTKVTEILANENIGRSQQVAQLKQYLAETRGIDVNSHEARNLAAQLEKNIDTNYLNISTANKVVLDNNLPLSVETAQKVAESYVAAQVSHNPQVLSNMNNSLKAGDTNAKVTLLAGNFEQLGFDADTAKERAQAVVAVAEGRVSLDKIPAVMDAVYKPGNSYKDIVAETKVERPLDTPLLRIEAEKALVTPLGSLGTTKAQLQEGLGAALQIAHIDDVSKLAVSITTTEVGLKYLSADDRVSFLKQSQNIFSQDLPDEERARQLNELFKDFNIQEVGAQDFLDRFHQIEVDLGKNGLEPSYAQTLSNFTFTSTLPHTNANLSHTIDAAMFTNQGLLIGDLSIEQLNQLDFGLSLTDVGVNSIQNLNQTYFLQIVNPIERYANTNIGTLPLYESGTPINYQSLNDFLLMTEALPSTEANRGIYTYLITVSAGTKSPDFIGLYGTDRPTLINDIMPFNASQLQFYLDQGYLAEFRLSRNAMETIAIEGFHVPVPMTGWQQLVYRSNIPFLRTFIPAPIHYSSAQPAGLYEALPSPMGIPQNRFGQLFSALAQKTGLNNLLSNAGGVLRGLTNLTPQGKLFNLLSKLLPSLLRFLGGAGGLLRTALTALSAALGGLLPLISPILAPAIALVLAGLFVSGVIIHTTITATFIKPREELASLNQYLTIEKGVSEISVPEGENCAEQRDSLSPNSNASPSLVYEQNEDFPSRGQRCFQYTVRITARDDVEALQIISASDYFEFITHDGNVRVNIPDDQQSDSQPETIPGPPFSGNSQNNVTTTLNAGQTVYYTYIVDFDASYFPNSFEDVAIQNNFRLSVAVTDANNGQDEFVEVDSATIRIGDAPILGGEGCWPTTGGISQLPYSRTGDVVTHVDADAYDIAASIGEEVFAPVSGRALIFPNNTGFEGSGNMVVITTGGAGDYLFQHLNNFASDLVGQSSVNVTAGQLIGYVGTTGNSSGPHLHYEYRAKWSTSSCSGPKGSCEGDSSTLAQIVPPDINGDPVRRRGQLVSSDTCGGSSSTNPVDATVGCFLFVSGTKEWAEDEIALVSQALQNYVLSDSVAEQLACTTGTVQLRRTGGSCTDEGGMWAGEVRNSSLIDIYDCMFSDQNTYGQYSAVHEVSHIIRLRNRTHDALAGEYSFFTSQGSTSFYGTTYPYDYSKQPTGNRPTPSDILRENTAEAFAACRFGSGYRGRTLPANFEEQCAAMESILNRLGGN